MPTYARSGMFGRLRLLPAMAARLARLGGKEQRFFIVLCWTWWCDLSDAVC
jgi:hypothetical protein